MSWPTVTMTQPGGLREPAVIEARERHRTGVMVTRRFRWAGTVKTPDFQRTMTRLRQEMEKLMATENGPVLLSGDLL